MRSAPGGEAAGAEKFSCTRWRRTAFRASIGSAAWNRNVLRTVTGTMCRTRTITTGSGVPGTPGSRSLHGGRVFARVGYVHGLLQRALPASGFRARSCPERGGSNINRTRSCGRAERLRSSGASTSLASIVPVECPPLIAHAVNDAGDDNAAASASVVDQILVRRK